jgi:hypothetical protein
MDENAISPRRYTRAHEEQKNHSQSYRYEGEYRISNKELRITKFREPKYSLSHFLQHSELLVHYSIFRYFSSVNLPVSLTEGPEALEGLEVSYQSPE